MERGKRKDKKKIKKLLGKMYKQNGETCMEAKEKYGKIWEEISLEFKIVYKQIKWKQKNSIIYKEEGDTEQIQNIYEKDNDNEKKLHYRKHLKVR